MNAGKFDVAVVPTRRRSAQMRKDFRPDWAPICGGEARQQLRFFAFDAKDALSEIVLYRSENDPGSEYETLVAKDG